jgi:hypothetical protein
MLNQPQVIGKPTAAVQFRQGYGLRASAGDGGLLREINNLKEIMRQGYGLGPAKLCFKPQCGLRQNADFQNMPTRSVLISGRERIMISRSA